MQQEVQEAIQGILNVLDIEYGGDVIVVEKKRSYSK